VNVFENEHVVFEPKKLARQVSPQIKTSFNQPKDAQIKVVRSH
jgi:hypothetical protein